MQEEQCSRRKEPQTHEPGDEDVLGTCEHHEQGSLGGEGHGRRGHKKSHMQEPVYCVSLMLTHSRNVRRT